MKFICSKLNVKFVAFKRFFQLGNTSSVQFFKSSISGCEIIMVSSAESMGMDRRVHDCRQIVDIYKKMRTK
jgi:hypothetical protein